MEIKNIFKGHQRSVKLKKNIVLSIFIRAANIVIGFLMVRLTLDYLDQTKYGIWLTLSSFITWFSFFEIGLGSGLKNRLAESLAINDFRVGKIYVSTTYAILSIIFGVLCVLFFATNFLLDWTKILNTDEDLYAELSLVALIVFTMFFVRFVLQLIQVVLTADQRPAMSSTIALLGRIVMLALIYLLTMFTKGSLVYLAWIISAVPIISLLLSSIYFFKGQYRHIAPSLKFVKFEYAKNLFSLGFKFFIIQIVGLIIYQSSNFIIAHFYGPSEVTTYNIAYKYFSILNMGFTILISPFWAAYTEAWVKQDLIWIKNTVKKLLFIWFLMSLGGIFMLFFANKFYELWIGDKVRIPYQLSLALLIYFISYTFGGVFNMFINGTGKVKLQMYSSVGGAIVFIFSAYFLINYSSLGIVSLVLASTISNFNGIFIAPIQYLKLINKRAKGIWNE